MWKVVLLLCGSVCSVLPLPLELVQYAVPYQQYQQYPLQRLQVVQTLPFREGVAAPQNVIYLANQDNKQLTLFENLQNWIGSLGSASTEDPPVEEAEGDKEPTTPIPAGEEEKKPLPDKEKLEAVEPLPLQPVQPLRPERPEPQPNLGVVPGATRIYLGQPQFFGNFAALQQGALVLRQQPVPLFPGVPVGGGPNVPYQPGRPPLASSDEVETLPLAARITGGTKNIGHLVRFQPLRKKQISEDEQQDDVQAEEVQSEPEIGPTIAQSKPAAIALAGPGGTASAGPLGQALVGPGGIAVSAPTATAVSGGARPPPIAPPQAAQAYKTFYMALNKPETLIKKIEQ